MDLAGYVAILRRRVIALILCLAAGVAGGYYLGHHPEKVYAATSRTFVNIPAQRGATLQEALAGTQLSANLIKTYASIASSELVAKHIVHSLGLTESPATLKGQLTAGSDLDTFIVDIRVTDADPQRAAQLANAASAALRVTVAHLEVNQSDPIQAQLIDSASVPTSPVSPNPTKDLALGIILGLLAGIALMAVLEALDRTIKSSSQAEHILGVPALGLVPRQRRRKRVALIADPTAPAAEPYRALRTAIRFLDPDKPVRTILVTSPAPGEGKTVTAANLAAAFAMSGERVAVVDADLRHAQLAEFYGLERSVGVTTVVMRRVELAEALQPLSVPGRLEVLASGPLPPNPAEILASGSMTNLLRALAADYDVVIIDTPPVLPVTDAVELAPQVDGVVMVLRYGRTTRHATAEAARRLHGVGANLVGYVLNAIPSTDARDYYADYRHAYESLPAQEGPHRQQTVDERPSSAPV